MPGKIILISSSFEDACFQTASREKLRGRTQENTHYPLGLAYLHSYLESRGHTVRTLFLNHCSFDDCLGILIRTTRELSPDIIGLQMFTSNRVSTYRLIEYLHKEFPSIRLVVGGIHASIMYEQLIKKYPFLIAVIGEGEITFSELLQELYCPKPDLSRVDGIAFMDNGSVLTTRPRDLICDLDTLPFPKHEVFLNEKSRWACIITSRGCPHCCSFCCLSSISRRKVRKRSVQNIIQEVEWLKAHYPHIPTIWIHDDSFFSDNKRIIEFCDEVIKRRLRIDFVCSARFKPICKKMVDKLEEANFKLVLLGLESGDEGILSSCHKGITQNDAREAFKLFSRSKIEICPFLIIGLPGENISTVMETIRFIKELQRIKYSYISDMALLIVYPGTEVYEIAKKRGMLSDDFWLLNEPTPVYTLENSFEQLLDFKELLYDHITMIRFFTLKGFKNQFTMLPHIIKYIFGYGDRKAKLLTFFSPLARKIVPPGLYGLLKERIQK